MIETVAGALVTVKMFVTSTAAIQLLLPGCEATTRTSPAPVKDRFVPSASVAGLFTTRKLTGSPDDAGAESPSVLVVT